MKKKRTFVEWLKYIEVKNKIKQKKDLYENMRMVSGQDLVNEGKLKSK